MISPSYVDGLELRIKELTKSNNALTAALQKVSDYNLRLESQVEQLSILCLAYEDKLPFPVMTSEIFDPVFKARTLLAQIKAEAGQAGYLECVKDFDLTRRYCNGWATWQMADFYAEKIRQGGAL